MLKKDELEQLINKHNRRLQILKEKEAVLGLNTPPEILIEIQDIKEKIEKLQAELKDLPSPFKELKGTGVSIDRLGQSGRKNWIKLKRKNSDSNLLFLETGDRLVTIGRSPDRDLVLKDPKVSWYHGYIECANNQYRYHHESKRNPTTIRRYGEEYLLNHNAQSQIILHNNDRIVIGNITLIVELNIEAGAPDYITTQTEIEDKIKQPYAVLELEHIGRYKIHSLLGRGGIGSVYKGYDPLLDRWVAIKSIAIQNVQRRARFRSEVRAAGSLKHPHITTIYDVGEHSDLAYIVMELVEGKTLADRLSSPVPWREAASLLLPICQALGYLHSRGIIHCDVKPANILISTNGQVKLTDFSIALMSTALHITKPSSMVGTLRYIAPEQVRNESVDGRTDLFSVGIILFELISGSHPFIQDTLAQVVFSITRPEPANLEPLIELAPPALIDLIERALSKDPAARFPNAEELTVALVNCLEETKT